MKPAMRKEIGARLKKMSAGRASAKSEAACAHLTLTPEFNAARAIMLYMPMPGELDVMPAARAAWQQDKTVLMPRVLMADRLMHAIPCSGADDDMEAGRYGILEPRASESWPPDQIDMIVVPGVAFDRKGNRLGRGAGFYDRFLAAPGVRAITCAVAFVEQFVEAVPLSDHDWPIDMLITDKEVLRFNRK